jgi:hypothetical protein
MLPHRTNTALGVVLLVVLATATTAVVPTVSAAEDDPLVSFTADDGDDTDWSATITNGLMGLLGRSKSPGEFVADVLDREPSATNVTTNIQSFVNDHDAELVAHTNRVLDEYDATVRNGTYVAALHVAPDPGEDRDNETIYLVAQADGTNLTSVEVVDSTALSPNASRMVSTFEAQDIDADLREYYDTYVVEDEVPESSYFVGLGAKYGRISELRGGDE